MNTSEVRACKICGELKPLTAFGQTVSEGNGRKYRRHECRACTYKRQAGWREKNREKLRVLGASNQAKCRARQRQRMGDEAFLKWEAEKQCAQRAVLKAEVYAAYGGFKCACCGETESSFLSIDHMNNDGYQLRKQQTQGSGARILWWLKRHGFPPGYQILCMNCQHGKARNGGICPHQRKV